MRIIVLGARGFIGSNLVKRLKRDGHEVQGLGRGEDMLWGGEVTIINCAGQLTDEECMYRDNVEFLFRMLQRYRHKRFIQLGSSSETGPMEGPRREDVACHPSNLYEATKLAATNLCLGYAAQYDMNVSVVRPFSVYGPHDTPRKMLPTLWRAWKEDKEFVCYPGGHDWIHIDDFVDGVVAVLNAPAEKTKGQIFNLGTGICTPNSGVLDMFNKAVGSGGVRFKVVLDKLHSYDVTDWRADTTKTLMTLGWSAKIPIQEGIKRFVNDEWFIEERAPGL
jgi:nucleoside-diphosphate-sugar epimerase